MIQRRVFLQQLLALPLISSSLLAGSLRTTRERDTDRDATSRFIYNNLVKYARQHNWENLPIGELIANLGFQLQGTPYVGGTLDTELSESCRVDLTGLDCVTFFESMLGIARTIKKGKSSFEDMLAEVQFTRYRNGELNGYTSRLHYTAEWIHNNVQKGVVQNITQELGGIPFALHVSFMSEHPKYYKQLQADSTLIPQMVDIENTINGYSHWHITKDHVAAIESKLQSGDIIAISTSKQGLDYAHTGMIYKDEKGIAHFLHASLAKKKVTLDDAISEYLKTVQTHIGISVMRPLEPVAK